jgi:hypothetical protein
LTNAVAARLIGPSRLYWETALRSSFEGIADVICRPRALRAEHAAEKSLLFARRVTLGSAKIRFIESIVRCRPVVDWRPRWRVGKARSGVWGDHALIGTNNSVPPVCVMHRSRVCRATQGDQKAQGQNRTHRFFSSRPRSACLGKAQAAPSQQIAASRLVTSVASLAPGVYFIMARPSYDQARRPREACRCVGRGRVGRQLAQGRRELALQQVGRYLGYNGFGVNAFRKAASAHSRRAV